MDSNRGTPGKRAFEKEQESMGYGPAKTDRNKEPSPFANKQPAGAAVARLLASSRKENCGIAYWKGCGCCCQKKATKVRRE